MKNYNLNEQIIFSDEKPIKRHFLNVKGFHAALICLKSGVEIPPHPEDYGVLLTVLEGKGIFTPLDKFLSNGVTPLDKFLSNGVTDINGEITLTKNQSVYMKKDEIRGIKAMEDLVVLGIQDRPKN